MLVIVGCCCSYFVVLPRAHSKVGWILSFGEQRLVRSRNADEAGRRTLRRNQYYIFEGGEFSKSDMTRYGTHYLVLVVSS